MTETKKELKIPKEGTPIVPTPTVPRPDTITLSKDVFDRMQKDIQMLKETADLRRMTLYQQRHKGEQLPIVGIREINGKVIMGWRLTKNDIFFSTEKNRWIEDQNVELMYEEGKSEEMPLKAFEENYNRIPCEQIGTIVEGENVALKLRRKDNGSEYVIGVQFVN